MPVFMFWGSITKPQFCTMAKINKYINRRDWTWDQVLIYIQKTEKGVNAHYDWYKPLIRAVSVRLLLMLCISPQQIKLITKMPVSFCLNQKSKGDPIRIEQVLAVKTHQNLNTMQATSCFSLGLVRLWGFIEGFGEICKGQACTVQHTSTM